mmetsp:Transcript_11937/g.34224  ORF Transcript_11937/g.34224 Transcript_11937/m.34224 type:complete len:89 (+) Transcript_11937:1716-1982(+)
MLSELATNRVANPLSSNLETDDAVVARTLPLTARDLGANDSVEDIKLNVATMAEDKIIMIGTIRIVRTGSELLWMMDLSTTTILVPVE